jgi:calcium/calmodulin-dependent protein kinase I
MWEEWKAALLTRTVLTTFHQDFIITKMIGQGAYATVFEVLKREDQKLYAIKVFNKQFMGK